MSYYLSVIKDSPLGFWKLDENSGTIAYDSSGSDNNGSYMGSILKSSMPLVAGGGHANIITNSNYLRFEINKDYSGQIGKGGFGIKNTGDNDFTLEIWFHPKNLTSLTPIFANGESMGIYWDNGNIVFKLKDKRLDYTVYYPDKYFYVVAVYTGSSMKLYVDGQLVNTLSTGKIDFDNESLIMQCGPCQNNKSYIVDAPALYRYTLNDNQILNHYYGAQTNSDSQIVLSDYGKLFKVTEKHQPDTEKFVYPVTKSWKYFINDNLLFNEKENYIYLNPESESGYFIEIIPLLHWKNYVASKIEWKATSGVEIFVSSDQTNWHLCTNGLNLSQINISDVGIIFIKVIFNSTNTNLYIPKMEYLGIYLYGQQLLYAHNGSEVIQASGGIRAANMIDIEASAPIMTAIITDIDGNINENSTIDDQLIESIGGKLDISNKEFSILSRYPDNGIRPRGNGFFTHTNDEIYNIELIFTPVEFGTGYLLYNEYSNVETSLSWNNGIISKSNISKIYINGEDRSTITDISDYIYLNEPNYILIKTELPISTDIFFNVKYANENMEGILPNNLYKNIAIYENQDIDARLHYQMYTGHDSVQVSGSVIQITEKDVKTYSKDWVVVNNA